VPLFRVADEHDLALRPENSYALQKSGIEDPAKHILLLSDLKDLHPYPATSTFALVDHNVLSAEFAPDRDISKATVSVILDHHKDEDLHQNAHPRTIKSAGSCASLVAAFSQSRVPRLPSELAILLLSAILIDTNGMKVGGKAEKADHDAAAFLIPQIHLSSDDPSVTSQPADQVIKDLTKALNHRKEEISHLPPRDLLRRDYKEKTHALSWIDSHPTIRVGMSTVPLRLKDWAEQGVLVEQGTAWMKERGLNVLGVLTAFKSKKTKQNKREMAWIVLQDEPNQFDHLPRRLWQGLEADQTILVREKKERKVHHLLGKKDLPDTIKVKIFDQGNPKASRKVTAPLIEQILTVKASL